MLFQPDARYTNQGGFYRCRVKHREKSREWFAGLEGLAYQERLLKSRRADALSRRRRRHRLLAEDRRMDGSLPQQG